MVNRAAVAVLVVWLSAIPLASAQTADPPPSTPPTPQEPVQVAPESPQRGFVSSLFHQLGNDLKHIPRRNSLTGPDAERCRSLPRVNRSTDVRCGRDGSYTVAASRDGPHRPLLERTNYPCEMTTHDSRESCCAARPVTRQLSTMSPQRPDGFGLCASGVVCAGASETAEPQTHPANIGALSGAGRDMGDALAASRRPHCVTARDAASHSLSLWGISPSIRARLRARERALHVVA
jgi:hypothetical protein